jgi:sec-independent protein translocase protein TatA
MSSIGFVGGIGPLELAIVLVIVLVIFGARRVPELGRSLGQGMREFKDSVSGKDGGDDRKLEAGEAGSVEERSTVAEQVPPPAADGDSESDRRTRTAGDATS